MEIIERLELEYFDNPFNRNSIWDSSLPGGIRVFKHIPIGNGYALSVQASEMHYCFPRGTMDDLTEYTHFEFAIINQGTLSRDPYHFKEYPRFKEIMEHYDVVFHTVPVELINDFYKWCVLNN